jgi:hypothetical protein
MHRKTNSVVYEKGGPHAVDRLVILIEYTMPWQEDGHGYDDFHKALSDSIIMNTEKESIIEVLKENNLDGVVGQYRPSIRVRKTGRELDCDFMRVPLYEMEIRLSFINVDPYEASASNLLGRASWKQGKPAMDQVDSIAVGEWTQAKKEIS